MLKIKNIKFVVVIVALFVGAMGVPVLAQKTRQQLEKEKAENKQKLDELRAILNETSSEKRASLGQLKAIKQQIAVQNRKIDLINDDLGLMTNELSDLEKAKLELDKDLDKLKQEYGKTIYMASKRNNSLLELSFLFSAPNFQQMMIRYKYLKQYTAERQKQVVEMKKVQDLIMAKSNNISHKKKDKEYALKDKLAETQSLEKLKGKQNEVVKELSSREAELKQEAAAIREENRRLEANLNRIVKREIEERRQRAAREKAERDRAEKAERDRLAKEAASKPTPTTPKAEPAIAKVEPKPEPKRNAETEGMTDEEISLASTFSASKGRLPWPVRSGFVSDHFGVKKHEDFNIYNENQGVDIQTSAGETVRAVYDGVVAEIENISGIRNAIYIQHGNFYTIYNKLKSVSIKRGQKVKAGETIGTVATIAGVSEVNFQIWKAVGDKSQNLNPDLWLKPR